MEPSVAELKQVLYMDRYFAALSELRRRSLETGREHADLTDLRLEELRVFSQNGEDGVLDALIRSLSPPPFFVEFGVEDGWSCNCRFLAEVRGWGGLFIEPDIHGFARLSERYRGQDSIKCLNTFVSPSNVSTLFAESEVPKLFGVLSIDTDGQDYWIWEALDSGFRPTIVVIEFNAEHPVESTAVEQQVDVVNGPLGRRWGASFAAMVSLAAKKGYELVHMDSTRVNLFFVAKEHADRCRTVGRTNPGSPNYGLRGRGLTDDIVYPNDVIKDRAQFFPKPG
jgi:hypothetical protein